MSQLTTTHTITTAPPRAAAAATAVKAGARLAYIDAIRMVLTILVIMVHAACTYMSMDVWMYRDLTQPISPANDVPLTLFVLLCQSFFMGLFFFLAGYFTPASYDRKGPARFWKDRLLRLGIPFALYTLVLTRLPNYINAIANEGFSGSIWQHSYQTFWDLADAGPTWFLFALLIFSLGYTLWRMLSRWLRLDLTWASRLPAPGTRALLLVGLGFGAAMFAVAQRWSILRAYEAWETITLMLAFFPAYIALFTFGALAYRSQWLAKIPGSLLRFWAPLSAALIAALPALMILGGALDGGVDVFFSGSSWQCAAMSLWFGLSCIALSATLTLWARERVLPQSKTAALAGPNNFTVYLIHPLVLIPITYAISFTALPVMLKLIVSVLLAIPACYLLADGLRRLPGARAIL